MKKILFIFCCLISATLYSQNTTKVSTSTSTTAPLVYTTRGSDSLLKLRDDKINFLLSGKTKDSVRIATLESQSTQFAKSITALQNAGFYVESGFWKINKTGDTLTFNSDSLIAKILPKIKVPVVDLKPVYDSIVNINNRSNTRSDSAAIAFNGKVDVKSTAITTIQTLADKVTAIKDFFNGAITFPQLEAKLQ